MSASTDDNFEEFDIVNKEDCGNGDTIDDVLKKANVDHSVKTIVVVRFSTIFII